MKATIAALISAAVIAPAAAQTATPEVDKRQVNQEERIQEGAQSGSLTPKETAKLEKGQAKVETKKEKAQSDGVVTDKERAKLAKAQKKQSKKIYKAKHNDKQVAPKAS
jgi:hypothetical protein